LGKGKFAAGEILKGSDGKNLSAGKAWKTPNDYEMDALAAVPCFVDHDGDGDLDLLIGNIAGGVIYIPNEGTPKKYSFDVTKRRPLQAGGSNIKVHGDSGPLAADWDGDGLTDLLVGSGDGSVWWYRNEGKKGDPRYAAGVALLGESPQSQQAVEYGVAPDRPGLRAKVGVADWNGDGRLDLLVGDFWQEKAAPKKLTDAEKARLAELKKKFEELQKVYGQGDAAAQKKTQEEYSNTWQEILSSIPTHARGSRGSPEGTREGHRDGEALSVADNLRDAFIGAGEDEVESQHPAATTARMSPAHDFPKRRHFRRGGSNKRARTVESFTIPTASPFAARAPRPSIVHDRKPVGNKGAVASGGPSVVGAVNHGRKVVDHELGPFDND
jgi:hypothetical protein